ncbi:hypothetical protein CWS72_02330 [Telmatospirillum siberiense]|uniref:Uncharacterized protein n=2 Tax=Telmatospirillum siberiense TaxID=382514 RepID=A0A2N3Q059_9PROT|nr:hypothetical protein CWS72_02330 [Telmatospirillum siberiense]
MDSVALRRLLALAAEPRGQPLVSLRAPVPPAPARRLGYGDRPACRDARRLGGRWWGKRRSVGDAKDGHPMTHAGSRNTETMIATLRTLLRTHPGDPKLLYNLAVFLETDGRADEAIEIYEQAINHAPALAEARTNLGIALLEKGRLDEAVSWLESSRRLQPGNPTIPYNLAIARQRQGKLAEAAETFRAAIALKAEFPQAYTNLGIVLLAREQFDAAIDAFRTALSLRTEDAKAHTNLGVALAKSGRPADGVAAHRRAIALAPLDAEIRSNLGEALRLDGQPEDAVAAFRAAIILRPDYPEAWNNLGALLHGLGRDDEAAEACRIVLTISPDHAEAAYNLGLALKASGRLDEAKAAYRTALKIRPLYAEALNNLGVIFQAQDLPDKAAEAFRGALAVTPDYPEAYSNLGVALVAMGLPEDSVTACGRAIHLDPGYAEALANLGNAYYDQGCFEEAVLAVRKALELRPEFPGALNNLGIALQAAGHLDEALETYRSALALRPDYPVARYNLATALLLNGDYEEGWREYEWRARGGVRTLYHRTFAEPAWTGEDLSGGTLLLQGEQGFGDVLQFARYVPLLAERVAQIYFEVQPGLERLLGRLAPNVRVSTAGEHRPTADRHLYLMSAPHLLGTSLASIPADSPYLTADPALAEAWGKRLSRLAGMKVGLVWAGNNRPHDPPANAIDRRRSLALARLTPMLSLAGVSFVSLQKDAPASQIKALPPELRPLDLMDGISDFADTAALVANLDLVITVDTAIAHLAGAMGKPVWILSRFDGCWRWLKDRDDSPWYPTVRLFRQTSPGDWGSPLAKVVRELEHLAGS